MPDWVFLQEVLNVKFGDEFLLHQAFVHRSYLNESARYSLSSNERLEFLGDALLGFVVAEGLYNQIPALGEGQMTKCRAALVNRDCLARVAGSFRLGEYLYLGQGEEKSGGRHKLRNLACVLEALIGAVLVDQGYLIAKDLVWRLLDREFKRMMDEGVETDYKTRLQEVAQAMQRGTPSYRVVDAIGPNHNKKFTVDVAVEGEVLGRGMGQSKQSAEKKAAQEALEKLLTY